MDALAVGFIILYICAALAFRCILCRRPKWRRINNAADLARQVSIPFFAAFGAGRRRRDGELARRDDGTVIERKIDIVPRRDPCPFGDDD